MKIRQRRQWLTDDKDLGGAELSGDGGLDDLMAPKGNGGEHRDGEGTGITKSCSGWPEIDGRRWNLVKKLAAAASFSGEIRRNQREIDGEGLGFRWRMAARRF